LLGPRGVAVAEFDAAGVDVGVVVQEYMDGEQNDYVLEVQKQFPGRFFMHGIPDYFNPEPDCQTSRRSLQARLQGLKLPGGHLAFANVPLDEPRYMPIYEQMAGEGHVLAVDLSEGEGQVSMMENILKRCPKLRVAIGHFGMVNRKLAGTVEPVRHEKRLHRNRRIHLALPKRRLSVPGRD